MAKFWADGFWAPGFWAPGFWDEGEPGTTVLQTRIDPQTGPAPSAAIVTVGLTSSPTGPGFTTAPSGPGLAGIPGGPNV